MVHIGEIVFAEEGDVSEVIDVSDSRLFSEIINLVDKYFCFFNKRDGLYVHYINILLENYWSRKEILDNFEARAEAFSETSYFVEKDAMSLASCF